MAAVLELRPELLVLADYGQIVPAALLECAHGALNLHPSLLPRYRGATPIPAAILAGDAETGVTLMRMDAGLDTGPIVAQARVALDGTETAPALEAASIEAIAADRCWWRPSARGCAARSRPTPQPTDGASLDPTAPARGWPPGPDTRGRRARAPGSRLCPVAGDLRRDDLARAAHRRRCVRRALRTRRRRRPSRRRRRRSRDRDLGRPPPPRPRSGSPVASR